MSRSRLILTVAAAFLFAAPMAVAQGVSLGPTNRTSTGSGMMGGGGYYYPGFGYSTYPMNNGYYGGYGYGNYGYGGYGAPIYAAPTAVPGLSGYFRFGGAGINYWHAPSGYYYPWFGGGTTAVVQQPIYVVQNGQTQSQLPPVSSMFSDMESYLDDCQKKNKIEDVQYNRLFQRLQDLRSKYDHERAAGGGILDPNDEQNMRIQVSNLAGEIARAVKPASTNTDKKMEVRNY
jgi:hypothetical protein